MEIFIFIAGMVIPVAINLLCFRTYSGLGVLVTVFMEWKIIRVGKDWRWKPYIKPE